jgi:hypothetical protein
MAGFESVKVGGIEHSDRLEAGGDLHDLASADTGGLAPTAVGRRLAQRFPDAMIWELNE